MEINDITPVQKERMEIAVKRILSARDLHFMIEDTIVDIFLDKVTNDMCIEIRAFMVGKAEEIKLLKNPPPQPKTKKKEPRKTNVRIIRI